MLTLTLARLFEGGNAGWRFYDESFLAGEAGIVERVGIDVRKVREVLSGSVTFASRAAAANG